MKTKKIKKEKEVIVPTAFTNSEPIGLLSLTFGQEDLNKLVDKVNELVVNANRVV